MTQPETAVPAETVEAPERIAKFLMLVMSGQVLMALALVGMTGLMLTSIALELDAEYDLTPLTTWSDDIVRLSNWAVYPTAIAFITWLYYAIGTNRLRGKKGKYGPGWSLGAFLIPIVSLVMPYLVMAEVFDNAPRNRNSKRRYLIAGWWGTFLLMRVSDWVTRFGFGTDDPTTTEELIAWNAAVLFQNGIWLAAALFALLLVREVTQRQTWPKRGHELAEVFA